MWVRLCLLLHPHSVVVHSPESLSKPCIHPNPSAEQMISQSLRYFSGSAPRSCQVQAGAPTAVCLTCLAVSFAIQSSLNNSRCFVKLLWLEFWNTVRVPSVVAFVSGLWPTASSSLQPCKLHPCPWEMPSGGQVVQIVIRNEPFAKLSWAWGVQLSAELLWWTIGFVLTTCRTFWRWDSHSLRFPFPQGLQNDFWLHWGAVSAEVWCSWSTRVPAHLILVVPRLDYSPWCQWQPLPVQQAKFGSTMLCNPQTRNQLAVVSLGKKSLFSYPSAASHLLQFPRGIPEAHFPQIPNLCLTKGLLSSHILALLSVQVW